MTLAPATGWHAMAGLIMIAHCIAPDPPAHPTVEAWLRGWVAFQADATLEPPTRHSIQSSASRWHAMATPNIYCLTAGRKFLP